MCKFKFRGESLATFLVYDVVMGAINVHLRVGGSPEPARSVSVKSLLFLSIIEELLKPLSGRLRR